MSFIQTWTKFIVMANPKWQQASKPFDSETKAWLGRAREKEKQSAEMKSLLT
jgi:hypothetical protein